MKVLKDGLKDRDRERGRETEKLYLIIFYPPEFHFSSSTAAIQHIRNGIDDL